MDLILKIEQDEALRKYVKDLVAGQIRSLSREDIKHMMQEEVTRKTGGADEYLRQVVREEFGTFIRRQTVYGNPTDYIKNITREIVRETAAGELRGLLAEALGVEKGKLNEKLAEMFQEAIQQAALRVVRGKQ